MLSLFFDFEGIQYEQNLQFQRRSGDFAEGSFGKGTKRTAFIERNRYERDGDQPPLETFRAYS